jgi:hypothetical protein
MCFKQKGSIPFSSIRLIRPVRDVRLLGIEFAHEAVDTHDLPQE